MTFRYNATPRQLNAAVLPAMGLALAEMKSLRFEVKTDSRFAVALLLSEKKPGGGNYIAVIWSNGEGWQPVVLAPSDFTENYTQGEPSDPDGKLDPDRVEHVGLIDFSQFLGGLTRDSQIYTEPHEGAHEILMRNFEVSRETNSSHPQVEWFSSGGASLTKADGALAVRYQAPDDSWIAFTRLGGLPGPVGATHLAMDIQSDRDAQLVISLREGSARRNVDFFAPAGKTIEHREILLSAFGTEEKPEAGKSQSMTILDVGGEAAPNTVTIRNLALVKR